MFEGFRDDRIDTTSATIRVRHGGTGPGLLLLHGNPQTSAMWRHVAPRFADRYHVVCPDLRGYGSSSKPPPGQDHINYAKRALAQDMIEVMAQLGHRTFQLTGHDRGGRVAHRMAYDHPDAVQKIAVLDIAPTREMYQRTDMAFATAYWHWFFMIQPHPIPEKMFGAEPVETLLARMGTPKEQGIFDGAWEEYVEAFSNPETIRATCDDYRAAATIDIAHDDAETHKIKQPLLCLWGSKGVIEAQFDALALWRLRAEQVEGRALPCGHYMPEEVPDQIVSELSAFFD